MPLLIRIKEIFIYISTYLIFTIVYLALTFSPMASYLKEIFSSYLNNKKLKIESSEELILEISKQGYDLEKVATALNFVNSFIPNQTIILVFMGLSFVVFFILANIIIHKGAHRYSAIVFITYAFGSISSGLGTVVLFITSFLIISLICTTIFLKNLYLEINVILVFFTVIYLILCFAMIMLEKSLQLGISKKINH